MDFTSIKQHALTIGLDDIGIVNIKRLDDDALYMDQWLAKGLHGNLSYLERNKERRYDPHILVPQVKHILIGVVRKEHIKGDYHRHIKSLFYRLDQWLQTGIEQQHIFCDSAPVLERRWAVEAGLGWIGKNRNFFHHTFGSIVHIGELFTDQKVMFEEPSIYTTLCAECQRCIDACPTGALKADIWDARLCKAYTHQRCWICQEVCPWNQKVIRALQASKPASVFI